MLKASRHIESAARTRNLRFPGLRANSPRLQPRSLRRAKAFPEILEAVACSSYNKYFQNAMIKIYLVCQILSVTK